MTPELWQRVKQLAAEALEADPSRREEILGAAGDDEVAREARSLLQAQDDSFLIAEPAHPERIGPYRIVRELGRGGMGAVYLAERADGEFDQRVAIKLIKRGMDTDAILARFRAERRMLARLEHPNIARLLDGGVTPTGLPYFVMEYIDGKPIDAHSAGLSETRVLRLFLTVCEAVEFAHRNMILHRDLKAPNVLIDTTGRPVLLDFGIAKALDDDTEWTQVMTPGAASPEQIAGTPLTTASDVFSLGVLLRKLTAAKGELALIMEKATAVEVDERYPTADALRRDIERYLNGQPVEARRGGTYYRVRKFVWRNWKSVSVAALVAVVIGALTVTAIREGRRADRRFREVRQIANSLLFDLHDAIAPLEGATQARALVVGQAIQYLDRLANESQGDNELDRELAQSYIKLGQVQGSYYEANLGLVGDAHASYEKAVHLLEGVERRQPYQPLVKAELAQALLRLASTENASGHAQQALTLCDRALAMLWLPHPRAALGRGMAHFGRAEAYLRLEKKAESDKARQQAIDEFAALAAKDPRNLEARRWMGNAWRRTMSADGVRKALAIDEQIVADNPKDAAALSNVAMDHGYLGALAMRESNFAAAASELARAVAMLRDHHRADAKDMRASVSFVHNLTQYAIALEKAGQTKLARDAIGEAGRTAAEIGAAVWSRPGNRETFAALQRAIARIQ